MKSLVNEPDAVSVTMVQKGNMSLRTSCSPRGYGQSHRKARSNYEGDSLVVKAAAIKENKRYLLILLKREYSNGRNDITCPCSSKAKVTEDLKAKIVSDLETRPDMVNKDLEAIEFQAQRILADAAKS